LDSDISSPYFLEVHRETNLIGVLHQSLGFYHHYLPFYESSSLNAFCISASNNVLISDVTWLCFDLIDSIFSTMEANWFWRGIGGIGILTLKISLFVTAGYEAPFAFETNSSINCFRFV